MSVCIGGPSSGQTDAKRVSGETVFARHGQSIDLEHLLVLKGKYVECKVWVVLG